MNHQQAGHIAGMVVGSWPNPPAPDIVIEAWVDVLETLDYPAAYEALKRLIISHGYRPNPQDLVDAICAVSPIRLVPEIVPELVEGVLPLETQKARLSELRRQLKSGGGLKHIDEDHGEPA